MRRNNPARDWPNTICVTFSRRASLRSSVGVVAALEPYRVRAQTFGQTEQLGEAIGALGVGGLAQGLDRNRCPGRVESGRELARAPDDALRNFVRPDAGEQALRRRPRALDRFLAQIVDHLVVDPLSGAAKRELPQCGQIAGSEEILGRPPGRLRHIDLALMQALDEFVGGQIDQNDVGGLLQHPVGNGLAHDNSGDARDNVGEAFEMLDVERRPDVNAGVEQLLHVLPALGVTAIGGVGVSEFVDDDQLGLARQRRVEIEFLDRPAMVLDLPTRQDFKPMNERARLGAAVGLDQADNDVNAFVLEAARVLQHRVGLADAGRGAEEHLQPAHSLPPERRQKRVRIGASIVGSARCGHRRWSALMMTLADPAPDSAAKRSLSARRSTPKTEFR